MRSQPKSLRALTLFSSSIKPAGMAPRPSRFQTTSRSYSSRHAHPNSTAKKISGNSCGRTGCRTEFSNPSTISSITAATLGTRSSIGRGKSCQSPAAIGQPQVTQSEDWYKPVPTWWLVVVGLLGIAAGIVTFAWPGITAILLVLFIGAWALVHGIFEIIGAIQ